MTHYLPTRQVDGAVVELDGLGAVAWQATWFDIRYGVRTGTGNFQPDGRRCDLRRSLVHA